MNAEARPQDPVGPAAAHVPAVAVLPHAAVQHGHGAGQERSGSGIPLQRVGDRRPPAQKVFTAIEAEWLPHDRCAHRITGDKQRLAHNAALARSINTVSRTSTRCTICRSNWYAAGVQGRAMSGCRQVSHLHQRDCCRTAQHGLIARSTSREEQARLAANLAGFLYSGRYSSGACCVFQSSVNELKNSSGFGAQTAGSPALRQCPRQSPWPVAQGFLRLRTRCAFSGDRASCAMCCTTASAQGAPWLPAQSCDQS